MGDLTPLHSSLHTGANLCKIFVKIQLKLYKITNLHSCIRQGPKHVLGKGKYSLRMKVVMIISVILSSCVRLR